MVLRSLPTLVRTTNTATVPLPRRQMDPVYSTPEFQRWRAHVVARADGQCEAIDNGYRCTKAQPEHRMFADHIIELKDGGSAFDPNNGQCLCSSHHVRKTIEARSKRLKA
jgi:hypothetical protein